MADPRAAAADPTLRPAGGPAAALGALATVARRVGPVRGLAALRHLNQDGGFDCPGCAWPDPARRDALEFCENGAKHVAHEATRRRADPDFFARHPLSDLRARSDRWLEAQGRLAHPMVRRPGTDHYGPISWEAAFARVARHLNALDAPDRVAFYTSGRTSNEAAFLLQLFARELGTNNLPDCSNLCHESSGAALSQTLGVGKGTVDLDDFAQADAVFVIGQNPGTNHPRMFTTLLEARRRGCRIVAINPLRERALVHFAHPKDPRAWLGQGTPIADLYLPVRVGGDVALLKALQKAVLEAESERPGRVLDAAFIRSCTEGFEAWREDLGRQPWDALLEASGISREAVDRAAAIYTESERVIVCWAMGLTQHVHAIANIQEIVNLALLRGNVGRPGAGLCPVRGHSNVQGDRTMGITTRPSPTFLGRLGAEFGFPPPRRPGLDSVGTIRALAEGRLRVLFCMGGNFAAASPDLAHTADALGRADLAVHVATTLNRTHVVAGAESILLPCLGRSERDVQGGRPQFVTVENSMSVVHRSEGRLAPASPQLRSEPAIVAGLAEAVLGPRSRVPWQALALDYDRIRERIARVVPGCEDMNRRVRAPGGFRLPNGARERRFDTPVGRARFTRHPLPRFDLGPGEWLMTTLRSHDQFNTTVYSDDDRYRGVFGDRRVVLLHPDDAAEAGFSPDQRVDVASHFRGVTRRVEGFRVHLYDVPRRCAAMYFPEANPLVPVDQLAEASGTPAYKSVVIRLTPVSPEPESLSSAP